MKKNQSDLKRIFQNIIDDATAKPGQDSDSLAKLYVEKLFRKSARIRKDLHGLLKIKNIKYLVHFTPFENVPNIIKYGLIPRGYLAKAPLNGIIRGYFTDDYRRDNNLKANCISVSFPNYKMFYMKRKNIGGDWAVIMLDPSILIRCNCTFFQINAASGASGQVGDQGFDKMFYNNATETDPTKTLREFLALPDYFTTNPQAEVMIQSMIPPRFILGIQVPTRSCQQEIYPKVKRYSADIDIKVSSDFFRPRHDFQYWKS